MFQDQHRYQIVASLYFTLSCSYQKVDTDLISCGGAANRTDLLPVFKLS